MKRLITHRNITLAIGILVAVLIALTIWVAGPVITLTGTSEGTSLQVPARESVQSAGLEVLEVLRNHFFRGVIE